MLQINVNEKSRTLGHEVGPSSLKSDKFKGDVKKEAKKSHSFVKIRKWFSFMDVFKRKKE